MKKLIKTDGTKYAQNLQAFAIVDTKQTDGKPIMVSAEVLEEAFENASAEDKAAFENVIHFDVEGEEITVTPTTSKQVKTPGQGYNAITKATINAVTSSIDNNIIPENIVSGKTILGVAGSFPDPKTYALMFHSGGNETTIKDALEAVEPELMGYLIQAFNSMDGASSYLVGVCTTTNIFTITNIDVTAENTFKFEYDNTQYSLEVYTDVETGDQSVIVTEITE